MLLIELDGPRAEVEAQAERAAAICRERGALEVQRGPRRGRARAALEGAQGGGGRGGPARRPTYLLQDAVVPRSKLPADHARDGRPSRARHGCCIANVFHAGDGNLHPLICYDDRGPERARARASRPTRSCCAACIALGGSVTGEHGVGLDKAKNLPLQYADADLNFMYRLRRVFDPDAHHEPRQAAALASGLRRGLPARSGPCCPPAPGSERGRPARALGEALRATSSAADARADDAASARRAAIDGGRAALGRRGPRRSSEVARGRSRSRTTEGLAVVAARERHRARARRARRARSTSCSISRGLDAVVEYKPDDLTVDACRRA